jgi:hypothetical protein
MLNFLPPRPSSGARFIPTQRPPAATPLFSRRDRREKTREPGGRENPLKKQIDTNLTKLYSPVQ